MINFDLNSEMLQMVYELVPNIHRQGNHLNFHCPLCGDGKKKSSRRGYWYINTGSYYCFNGGCVANEKGLNGLQFLSLLTGKSVTEIKTELIKRAGTFRHALSAQPLSTQTNELEDIFGTLKEKKKSTILNDDWVELPSQVQKVVDQRKIYQSPFIAKDWRLYYDKKKNRLVIPWTKEYYQERALTKKQEYEEGKYLFPPNVDKPIYGLDTIDTNFKYLFLLEGVFDAIWVKNGLAVGSLILSEKQKETLKAYSDYKIVYFMDNQFKDQSARNQTIKIAKQKPFQDLFIWPKKLAMFKDVNETIIYSDDFIKLWSNQKFLTQNIANGIKASLLIKN